MGKKVAIFSDIHLGVHQNSDFWLGVANQWSDWYIEDLKSKGISDIIFCGDFFHYRDEISVKTLNFAKDFLDKFSDFNITMITGNHDAWYKDTSEINSLSILRGYSNLTIYDKMAQCNIHGVNTVFCPWGTQLKDIPDCDLVFGHFELVNFKMNSFKVCDHGDNPEALANKAPLVFSGHFHLRASRKFDNSEIIYVGNPYEMDFGDSGQTKGYYVLDLEDLSYEFYKNTVTPKHVKIFLSKLITQKDPEAYFRSEVTGNIIKFIVDKNVNSADMDLLVTKLASYKPSDIRIDYDANYNKVQFAEDNEFDLSGVDMSEAITEFINMLDIDNKSEVAKYTTELYNRSVDRPK